ncbi:MAG: hypothetical protein DRJ05_05550 [Bacteroidetes bacterium]|nr:MAG: hypothetical protein DRJ05_05550 [Bacteroidota bacterium]
MIKKTILTSLLFAIAVLSVFAQEFGVGQWREHLPYASTISVTEGNGLVFCATPYSIFYFNKNDNSVRRLTRISGLSDMGIEKIDYNHPNNTLVIAYSNTNIDLIKGNIITNMPDIINSNAITPEEKTVSNILFIDKKAYLSCGFGVVVIDLKNQEVEDTWYIGPNGSHLRVFDLTVNDTSFIAATQSGIYYADRNSTTLAYFGSWTKDNTTIFPDAEYHSIEINAGKIFAHKPGPGYAKDTLIFSDGNLWQTDETIFNHSDIYSLRSFNNILYISYNSSAKGFDENLDVVYNLWSYDGITAAPRDIYINSDIWIADDRSGLVWQRSGWDFEIITPNGPEKAAVFDISASGTNVWSVPGGRTLGWANIYQHAFISSFIDEKWGTYSGSDYEALDTLSDMLSIIVNPKNPNQIFAGSWSGGMVEFDNNGLVNVYNEQNSSLGYNLVGGGTVIKVGGFAFDDNGYLWVSNSGAENVLSVRIPDGSKDGRWTSFYLESFTSGKDIGKVTIDNSQQKWLVMKADHQTIAVFTDNGTVENTSDDEVKKLTSAVGNGNIPGNKVFSIACDNDGEVWVGTDAGIAVFYSPENIFSNYDFDAQQILIPRNDGSGLADILLEFETVTAIAIDGSNKKWIGTDRSGIFLLSADGLEEIHHFTEDNSPLFSNNITSIAINDNGEVFIGTAKGLISYKGSATPGGETNTDVYAYPNPVRPGYTGLIAIKGLVDNASIKITDVNGSLIYDTYAEGGQAVWNGNNFSGQRAQSGVYLVFISNDDGSQTQVAKILIIN